MVLRPEDELKHPSTSDPDWRESMWFCFDLPEHKMGGAVYYSYMPNTANPTASFSVYMTKGWNRELTGPFYSFQKEIPIPDADWDDLRIGDVAHYKRIDALKRWHISVHDGDRFDLEMDADFFGGGWHYIDNTFATPKYLAADRYHRPWAAQGEMVIDGERYALDDITGDSDHSWGPRQWPPLYKSKYTAGQCGRDWAFHAFSGVALDGGVFPYGFVWDGEKMSPISGLEISPHYDDDGIQRAVTMNIVDAESRMSRIEGESFCSSPTESEDVRNNDCYFDFEVNGGEHSGSGILSFYWNREYYNRVLKR